MEKKGAEPKLYIGSGINATRGVTIGIRSYSKSYQQLPLHAGISIKKGYTISHIGILCSTPLPIPGLIARARAFFLALEATSTILLHAKFSITTDSYYKHLLLWDRASIEWAPLCSHLSLQEAVKGDLAMSIEETEMAAAFRKARAKEIHIPVCHRSRARRRAEDPSAYKRYATEVKRNWAEKNPERALAIASKL